MNPIIPSLLAISMVTGCATVATNPLDKSTPAGSAKNAVQTAQKNIDNDAGFMQNEAVAADGRKDIFIKGPTTLPTWLAKKRIVARLQPGMSIKAIVAYLGNEHNISAVFPEEAEASGSTDYYDTLRKSRFYLPYYSGTLGEFLELVGNATDTWPVWDQGALRFEPRVTVTMVVPQYEELINQLSDALVARGYSSYYDGIGLAPTLSSKGLDSASDTGSNQEASKSSSTSTSVETRKSTSSRPNQNISPNKPDTHKLFSVNAQSGLLTIQVSPREYQDLKQFLNYFVQNTVLVKMHLVTVAVSQNENTSQGINWSKLQLAASSGGTVNSVFNSVSGPMQGSTETTLTNGTASTITKLTDAAQAVSAVMANGSGLNWGIVGKQFNLTGMLNYLRTFGQTDTTQNLMLQSISGGTVLYRQVKQVPYISEIAATSTGTTTTTTTGSTKTEKAKDGIELKMSPRYNANTNIVTVNMDLTQSAVLGFNDLNAGLQLGKLSQPTTSDSSLGNSVLELRPGETAVVGGLTTEAIERNKTTPVGLEESKLAGRDAKVTRQNLYVVVTPYISRLGSLREERLAAPDTEKTEPAALKVTDVTSDTAVSDINAKPKKLKRKP